jgi:hypothetical protein
MDSELSQGEMEAVREHLMCCSACRLEHETLIQTKRAVASLASRVSRDEIARLLADAAVENRSPRPLFGKINPIAATAFLSLAGLWLATTSLDGPRDWRHPIAFPEYEPVPAAVTPISMTPPVAGPVTIATVSNPITLYEVTPGHMVVGQATFRQVRLYSNAVRPPSLHDIIGHVFGWSGGRPSHPMASGLVMSSGENGMFAPTLSMGRVLNERDSVSDDESLLQTASFTGHYSAVSTMH